MVKKAEVILNYQNIIDQPPLSPQVLYSNSCRNDGITVSSWKPVWIRNAKANKARFGSFAEHGIGKLWGAHQYKPVIVAGAGPSLKGNAHKFKDRGQIPLVSCLHNFHYLEDMGAAPDYYVTLDAGPVTIEEVSEGGSKTPEEYWAMTKNRVLLAYIGSDPGLLEKWQGKVFFYSCPIPDPGTEKELNEIEIFSQYVSTGGNVLGACLYIARGFLGASQIIFTGSDFCFSYDHKFHAWDSKYDASLGQCVPLTDVYGIKRVTWQSYANFKGWFDYIGLQVPGYYVNASEGGCLGSYPEGNLSCFKYKDLEQVFSELNMNSHTKGQSENPSIEQKVILF